MSFDIFMGTFRDGESVMIDTKLFREIFGREFIDKDPGFCRVVYADGGADIYGDLDEPEMDGLTFNHSGGDIFFTALFELADRTGSVVYWPDEGRSAAVTKPEIIAHLPEDMVESLGTPFVVRNGTELRDAITRRIDPADSP